MISQKGVPASTAFSNVNVTVNPLIEHISEHVFESTRSIPNPDKYCYGNIMSTYPN